MNERRRTAVLCAVFFASGVSALLFETLWLRLAGIALGNSVWAGSMVLTSFMAGLALGNGLAASKLARLASPLRLYAALEAAVGVSGLTIVLLLPSLTYALAPILRPFAERPVALNGMRLAFAALLMIIPTTAMGATLPLLIRAIAGDESFGARLGLLYGWNTAGAVAGALAGEMVLIKAFGLRGTGVVAMSLNVLAAIVAIAIGTPAASRPVRRLPAGASSLFRPLAAAFLSGAILLALEVVWFRFLLLFTDGTSLAFALMLAVVLLGIASGGLIASRVFRIDADADRFTAATALACGVATAICFAGFAPGAAPGLVSAEIVARDAVASLRLMLLTSIGSGLLFPFIGRTLQKQIGDETASAAWLTLANTIGAAIGAFAGGFVLLPRLGMERSLFALACAYALVAMLMMQRQSRIASAIAAVALVITLALFPFGIIEKTFMPMISANYTGAGERVIGVREGLTETDTILRSDLLGEPYTYRLLTNGISMSGTTLLARRYMSLFVDLPMALHPTATRALLISYGVGTTAKTLTETPGLQSIDVVDISRDVLEMSRLRRFKGGHPLDDPRVRVHIEDGRFFLLTSAQHFDLITAEPPPPKDAGIVNLYSREYFQLMRSRLAEGGLATYWLPIYQLRESEGKAIIRAFCDAFSDCSLWSGAGPEMILMGSRGARPVTRAGFEQRWQNPTTAETLTGIGIESPELLGTLFIADATWLQRFASDAEPLVDDKPLRLSAHPVAELPGAFQQLFDVRAAQRRFTESRWIATIWPPELRQKTAEAFIYRDMADRAFLTQGQPTASPLYSQTAYVLAHSSYRALPAILMGSDARQQEIAAAARARGLITPHVMWIDGVRALSERRYADAAALLRDASRGNPKSASWARDAAFAEEVRSRLGH